MGKWFLSPPPLFPFHWIFNSQSLQANCGSATSANYDENWHGLEKLDGRHSPDDRWTAFRRPVPVGGPLYGGPKRYPLVRSPISGALTAGNQITTVKRWSRRASKTRRATIHPGEPGAIKVFGTRENWETRRSVLLLRFHDYFHDFIVEMWRQVSNTRARRVDRVGESGRALTLIFAFDCTRRGKKCSKRLDCETRQQKYVQKLFIIHQKERKKKKNLSRILSRALVFPESILLSVVSYHERK